MAFSIDRFHPLGAKPDAPIELDRSHPLLVGCKFYAPVLWFPHDVVDLISRRYPDIFSTGRKILRSGSDFGITSNSSAYVAEFNSPVPTHPNAIGENITIIFSGFAGDPSLTGYVLNACWNGHYSSSDDGWDLVQDRSGGNLRCRFDASTADHSVQPPRTPLMGEHVSLVFQHTFGTRNYQGIGIVGSGEYSIKGPKSIEGNWNQTAQTTDPLKLFLDTGGRFYYTSFATFDRRLSLEELIWYHNDPYAPIRRRRVLVPVAATGPANHTASLTSGAQPATTSFTTTLGYKSTLAAGAQSATTSLTAKLDDPAALAASAQPATTNLTAKLDYSTTLAADAQPAAANFTADVQSVGNHTSTLAASAQPAATSFTNILGYQATLFTGAQAATTSFTNILGYQATLYSGAQSAKTALTADITSTNDTATLSAGAQPATASFIGIVGYKAFFSAGAQPAVTSFTNTLGYQASLTSGTQPAITNFTAHVPEALTAALSAGVSPATVSLSMTAPIRYNREIGAMEFAAPSASGITEYDPPSKDLGDVELY